MTQAIEIDPDTHNPAAEEHHLGSLMLSLTHRAHLADALQALNPTDIYNPHLEIMWDAARTIHAAGGYVTAKAILGKTDNLAIRRKIQEYTAQPVKISQIRTDIATIQQAARMRRLIQVGQRIIQRALEAPDYSTAHEGAIAALAGLEDAEPASDVIPFSRLADDWWAAQGDDNSTRRPVVPSPWPELDRVLNGGFYPKRLYVVAARPGAGKSIVGLNVAAHAAELGHTALVFSAEMGTQEVTGRLMAAGAGAEYGQIVRYDMDSFNASRVQEYHERNRNMPLFVVDNPSMTVEYIAATARTHRRTHDLRLMVVDYLQLLNATDSRVVREQQVAHISKTLKQLAMELDITIVEIAQLNRNAAKDSRKPTPADLRESGSLEQDADVVLLLHHELIDDQPTGEVEVLVPKNRTGPVADVTLRWCGYQAAIR